MKVYDGAFTVEHKDDNSPLTLADLESQRIIIEGLRRLTPDVPVLSEESATGALVRAAILAGAMGGGPARRHS